MKKIILLPVFVLFGIMSLHAQNDSDIELFVKDMRFLAGAFAQPASEGAAYQASAGWFSSATSLELWEFRPSVHGNALFVPTSKQSFTVSDGDVGLLSVEGGGAAKVPTAFGGKTEVYYQGFIDAAPIYSGEVRFKAFDGIGKDYVPHAFVQLAVGLPQETELTIRAMPEVTIDGVQASTYGLGLKHNLSQYFRFNEPEDIQLAAGLSYSKFNVNYEFEPIVVQNIVTMDLIDVEANLWMLEAIASKRYGNFEVFGALGATMSDFSYVMGGSGTYLGLVNTELEALGDSETQFKGDIGFNLHFGNFRLSTMATAGKFFNANLGLHYKI